MDVIADAYGHARKDTRRPSLPPFHAVFRGAVLPPPQVPPPQGTSVSTLFHTIFHIIFIFSFIFFGRIKRITNFASAPEKLGVRDRVVKIVYHPEVGFHWPHFFYHLFQYLLFCNIEEDAPLSLFFFSPIHPSPPSLSLHPSASRSWLASLRSSGSTPLGHPPRLFLHTKTAAIFMIFHVFSKIPFIFFGRKKNITNFAAWEL